MSTVSDGCVTRRCLSHGQMIDLTRSTPSPGPSTSSNQTEVACSSAASDLYTQLQGLEEQDGVIRNDEFLFCTLCDHFIDIYDGVLIRNCLHQICIECIRKVIIDCAVITVKCPVADCEYPVQDREIRSLLTQEENECHMNKIFETE